MISGLINERGSLRSLLLSWLDAKTFKEFSAVKIQRCIIINTMFVLAQILADNLIIVKLFVW